MSIVVGTAGHIDHGKTALLRALTGIDADRLPEEQRRGMTIDVGYAHLRLPDGEELDFVDVPGHDRLVGNMLVGAGEIDAALLVVAADDGPRAQTLEHLELLDGLGISAAVCAVTKVDLVEEARVGTVVATMGELLGRTTLAGSPIRAVSALSGDGLDGLRTELERLRDRVRSAGLPSAGRPPRLAIDRAFSIKGRGLVVTGTLRGGPLRRGDLLRIEPSGGSVRARELQVHSASVDAVEGGGRVAINVAAAGSERTLSRGDVLTTDAAVTPTDDMLVLVHRPAAVRGAAIPWPPRAAEALRLHSGTTQVDAAISRGKRDRADAGGGRLVVRVRTARPIAAAIGDRLVLRRPSPPSTLASGVILDATAPSGPARRRVNSDRLAALAVAVTRPDPVSTFAARLDLHGALPSSESPDNASPAHRTRWVLAADVEEHLRRTVISIVAETAPVNDGAALEEVRREVARSLRREVRIDPRFAVAVAERVVDDIATTEEIVHDRGRLRVPGQAPRSVDPATAQAMDQLVAALDRPDPPSLSDAARAAHCPPDAVRLLEADGRIVRLDGDLAYAGSAFDAISSRALDLAASDPITPAAFRDATGTSRKYVLAVLEELDRRGILARTPAGHVRGPRAPRIPG